jgi:thymidylate kinase
MRIVVEGMDFTGKSTVCRHLGELLQRDGWQVRRSTTSLAGGLMPPLIEAAYRSRLLTDAARSTVYHLAYLPDLLLPARSAPRVALLQESYICRVWAHDDARRRPLLEAVARRLSRALHQRVDLAVLLRAPYDIRRSRYLSTGVANGRDEQRFSSDGREEQHRVETALERRAAQCGYQLIDSASCSPQETAQAIALLVRAAADADRP